MNTEKTNNMCKVLENDVKLDPTPYTAKVNPDVFTKPAVTISTILEERGSRYGDFIGHAKITQDLKYIMRQSPNWPLLSEDKKEALEMTAHKIGRILNGDPSYKDSWVDIEGYIYLVSVTLKD